MPTLTEARNEWAEALTAAKDVASNPEAYEKAWADAESKRKVFENLQKVSEQEKQLGTSENTVREMAHDLRNPSDAEQIKPVTPTQANADPSKFVKVGDLIYPVASATSEGWMKGKAVAVQHPDILKRLSPEMREEKAKQEEAFAYYFRHGRAALANRKPELLKFLNALQEDTDTEGGYLVPTDQRFEVIRDPGALGGQMRQRSRVFTTTRDGGTLPTATSVTWAGIAEEASNNDSDPAFNSVAFTIRKSGANNRLSMELLADSAINIPALLGTLYGESKGRYEDQQGIEGDGTTEPLGLRTTGPAANGGAIADTTDLWTLAAPTAAEVIAAYFELDAQWRGNASWFMTSSLMARIVAIGSAAAGIHFTELLTGNPGMTLMGRPVFFFDGTGWDDAATIAANEEVGAFGDFNQYYFVDRLGMSVARDDSVYFATDQVAFKARVRYDSLYAIAGAFLILKGAAG